MSSTAALTRWCKHAGHRVPPPDPLGDSEEHDVEPETVPGQLRVGPVVPSNQHVLHLCGEGMERFGVGGQVSGFGLQSLLAAARRACDEGDSTSDFEPAFAEVLQFIQQHPACRVDAVATMAAALHGTQALPWELLAFLMHELRWPEVKVEATRVIEQSEDWRIKTALSHVVAAYEEDWPDADLYQRWQKPASP